MTSDATMRAVRLHATAPVVAQADVRIERQPPRDVGPAEVLIDVQACGLGALDLAVVTDGVPRRGELPLTLGREAAGTIARVGAEVVDWQPGDRVAVLPEQPCGACGYCRIGRENLCSDVRVAGIDHDGALAAQLVAVADRLVPLPPDIAVHEAAIVPDTVGTASHAIKRAGLGEGSILTVFGLGGVGMHVLLLAKLAGAHVIGVDVDAVNLERAVAWGADAVIDASVDDPVLVVAELTDGGGDRAIEVAGSITAADQAIRSVAPGGRVVLAGRIPQPLTTATIGQVAATEVEIVGSGSPTAQDVGELFDLVEDGHLDLGRSVTETVHLDDVPAALSRLEQRHGHPVRIVVTDLS